MDAAVKRPRRNSINTVDSVARDLDALNRRYTTLVTLLQDRVRKLAIIYPDDVTLQVSLSSELYVFDYFTFW